MLALVGALWDRKLGPIPPTVSDQLCFQDLSRPVGYKNHNNFQHECLFSNLCMPENPTPDLEFKIVDKL